MTIHPTHLTTNLSRFGAKSFLAKRAAKGLVKIGIVAPVPL